MQKTILLLLFFFLTMLHADTSIKTVDLSVSNHAVGQALLEYEDPTAKMTLTQIRELPSDHFKPLNKAVASHPCTTSAFWYQVKVLNKEKKPVSRLMVLEPAWLDSVNITVISPQGTLQTYQGGNIYPYAKREMDHYLTNFKHQFEPGVSMLYIQVKTRDPFVVSFSVMEASDFLAKQSSESLYIGLIYGGIAALLFYNLFIFIGTKQRRYFYYVLYLSAFLVMNASYNGYTFMFLLEDHPVVQNWLQSISIYAFSLTALLFSSSFLNLHKYHQRLYKVTLFAIIFIVMVALLSAYMGGYHYNVMFSIILVMLVSIYIFIIALYSWLQGNRSARFFLLGAASGLIGAIITALTVLSFIPFSYITYKANDFGMYIDVILLSLALSDHMKMTLEKKIIAEKQAKTDITTGLYNRRAYYEISEVEFQRLLRHKRSLSVIIFDIDHFKSINDTYGHGTGDKVLEGVGHIVKNLIREYDYAFRMGGDEFLVLLPETNDRQATQLAERIRREIEKYKLKENRSLEITASFGITQYTYRDTNIEKVTRRADEALYQAKKAGRNRVEIIERFAIV
ncbi:MAG: GGDEF domain-containing protein [Epsilonproteobacteria bacterium]|nr:MAG: GGDEF domain-containing protein [Campylobacterota bacterium]